MPDQWRAKAACLGDIPELWDHEDPDALAVCETCPVIDRCLADALDAESLGALDKYGVYGIRGGMTSDERMPLVAERKEARAKAARDAVTINDRCGTQAGYQAHYKRGEKPCEACITAHHMLRAQIRQKRAENPPGPKPINHGTRGGYGTHVRRGETPCEECYAGRREAEKRRRARARERRRAVSA